MRGEDQAQEFNVQVLGAKAVQSQGQERHRLLISDGMYTYSFSMLATQLNHLIHEKKLEQNTIVKIKKYICNKVAGGKKLIILMELEIVKPGAEVGNRIGNPVAIANDGSSPPAADNQNSDPNVGAVKRNMAGGGLGALPAKMPATNRSVLSSHSSSLSSSNGGHVVSPISSITPYQNKWTIKARVTGKSDIRTWNKASGSGKLFSMDLMDESGEIRATAFKEQCDQYYDMIQVGKVYFISRCSVKAANKAYCKLNNDYELTFKDNVLVEPVGEDDVSDVPTMSYNFAGISDLSSAGKDSLVDVIGICKTSNELVNITTRAGKELTKREISICDQSNTEVTLTLWGSTAETFHADGNPVVAVKGAKVSDYNGVTLSGGTVLVNPDIDQSHKLKGWWETGGATSSINSLTVQGQRSGGAETGSMKTLSEVKMENLGGTSDRGEYYSCLASITYIGKDKALYKACPNQCDGRDCNKKVQENGDGTYRCEKCSMDLNNFKWRLILSFNMGDHSDSTWSNCFQETAEKLLGYSSEEIGNCFEGDEERYNAIFSEATFKTYMFRMRAKADTYNDETRVKHTAVSIDNIDYAAVNKMLIKEIESLGGFVPDAINREKYV